MRLHFRQGIIRALAVGGSPYFLEPDHVNNAVSIVILSERLMVTAAYGDDNYIHEHRETLLAWGPMVWNSAWGDEDPSPTYHLYWDWNIGTGQVTYGFTPWEPFVGTVQPLHPEIDQHWFDTTEVLMKVWDGLVWQPKIRVFAGSYNPISSIATHMPLGTQVGIEDENVDYEAGWVIYGMDNKAVLQPNGKFFTSTTDGNTYHGSFTSPVRLELLSSQAIADEPIPAWYAVTNLGDGRIILAANNDINKYPIGLVTKELLPGESSMVVSYGIVYNDQWDWDAANGKDLFCGPQGELIQGFPVELGVNVIKVGSIIDRRSILVDIDRFGEITVTAEGEDFDHDAVNITYHHGSNVDYPDVQTVLDFLLYEPLELLSFTGGSINEIGSTVTDVTLAWTYNDGPDPAHLVPPTVASQTLTDYPGLQVTDRSHHFSGLTITSNKTYTIDAFDPRGVEVSDTQTVGFSYKRYWGVSANLTVTDAEIRAMSQEFASSYPKAQVNYNCSGGRYPYYCYPAAWGNPASILVGGFFYSDYTITVRAFTNASGHTASYNIIRFNGIQTASVIRVDYAN